MNILALDLSTVTGVAIGEAGLKPETTVWRMPAGDGSEVGRFLASFETKLVNALPGVDVLVFEAPFLGPQLANNMHTARRLIGLAAICEKVAFEHKVEVFECTIPTVRKAFCGHGRPKDPKKVVMAAAKARGFTPHTHHEGDALACWWWTVICQKPEYADRYDPLFKHTDLPGLNF